MEWWTKSLSVNRTRSSTSICEATTQCISNVCALGKVLGCYYSMFMSTTAPKSKDVDQTQLNVEFSFLEAMLDCY